MKQDTLFILLITATLLGGIYLKDKTESTFSALEAEAKANVVVKEIEPTPKAYGLPIDSFVVELGRVKKNEFISEIWQNMGLEYTVVHEMVTNTKAIFDVRKIRHGSNYTAFYSTDSTKQLMYFVYQGNPVDYVKFSFGTDSLFAVAEKKPVTTKLLTATGEIERSLWGALTDKNLNPELSGKMSDIYAWSIDFFGLQKGDRFKVIYEEQFVDTVSVGVGKIHACTFSHMQKDFQAFAFTQDSVESYYDQEGNSLRKAFLKAPLRFSRISSRFSYGRMHPILKIRRPHLGIDYAAPSGTPVYAIGDGKVIARGYQKRGGGNYIKIKHNGVYTTVYMHLKGFAKGMAVGAMVNQGDLIAYVGSTGLSTGPHLDFRFFRNGKAIDPLKVEAPSVEPVKEANQKQFAQVKQHYLTQLGEIQYAALKFSN